MRRSVVAAICPCDHLSLQHFVCNDLSATFCPSASENHFTSIASQNYIVGKVRYSGYSQNRFSRIDLANEMVGMVGYPGYSRSHFSYYRVISCSYVYYWWSLTQTDRVWQRSTLEAFFILLTVIFGWKRDLFEKSPLGDWWTFSYKYV